MRIRSGHANVYQSVSPRRVRRAAATSARAPVTLAASGSAPAVRVTVRDLADAHAFRVHERRFVKRCREAGLARSSTMPPRAPVTTPGGDEAMRAPIAEHPQPMAVFCANDVVVVGRPRRCGIAEPATGDVLRDVEELFS